MQEGRGGLLNDDMGLGKTLSMLALIVHTLGEARSFVGETGHEKRSGTTLVVTPKTSKFGSNSDTQTQKITLVAIQNWVSEISRYVHS